MKRRTLVCCATLGALVLSGLVLLLSVKGDAVNRRNYERIKIGITKAEVIEILGREADYGPGEAESFSLGSTVLTHMMDTQAHVWESPEFRIYVLFDEHWTVTGTGWSELTRETLFSKVRRWLRLG
jgi:hypothetical protein